MHMSMVSPRGGGGWGNVGTLQTSNAIFPLSGDYFSSSYPQCPLVPGALQLCQQHANEHNLHFNEPRLKLDQAMQPKVGNKQQYSE